MISDSGFRDAFNPNFYSEVEDKLDLNDHEKDALLNLMPNLPMSGELTTDLHHFVGRLRELHLSSSSVDKLTTTFEKVHQTASEALRTETKPVSQSTLEKPQRTGLTKLPDEIAHHLNQLVSQKKITSEQERLLTNAYLNSFKVPPQKQMSAFHQEIDALKTAGHIRGEQAYKQKQDYRNLIIGKVAIKTPTNVTDDGMIKTTQTDYTREELKQMNLSFLKRLVGDLKESIPSKLNGLLLKPSFLPENKMAIYNQHVNVLQARTDNATLHRHEFELLSNNPKQLTSSLVIKSGQTKPKFEAEWIEYGKSYNDSKVNTTKVDFANKFLGGGWVSHHLGFLQEEQIFAHHPELSLLASEGASVKEQREEGDGGILTRKGGKKAGKGKATPQLIRGKGMLAFASLPGFNLKDKKDIHLKKKDLNLSKLQPNSVDYGILAMAAPEHEKGQSHDMASLRDLFSTAYTGYHGTVQLDRSEGKQTAIETGAWGAGDFNNKLNVSIAIQYLAAISAEVSEISFHGVKADKAVAFVDDFLAKHPNCTVEEVLNEIQAQQNNF